MQRAARWALFSLALLPLASASHQGPADVNALDLNVLVYHPYPDENGDPWGFPSRPINGSDVDWMQATYGAFFYPTAVFDGVLRFDETSQGEGGGEFQETHAAYEGALASRVDRDAPATIRINGRVEGRTLIANLTVEPDAAFAHEELLLRIVYVEDDVTFNGGSGILHHRFVARGEHQVPAPPLDGAFQIEKDFALAESVDPQNAGVVVILQNFDEDSDLFEWKEVLQSATWISRQQGPTVQSVRGVLLELYSATWCTACVVGDAVADDLANAYGVPSSRVEEDQYEYLRPGDWWKVAVAAVGAVGLVSWMRRQRLRGDRA